MSAPHLYRIVYRQQALEDLHHCRVALAKAREELEAARGTADEKRCRRRLGRRERALAYAKRRAR